MSKKIVVGGVAAVVLVGATWAGTTWYSGQKVESVYHEAIQQANKESLSPISFKLTSYKRGFLSSKANWEASVVLDPCQPNDALVLTGYDDIHQGFIPSFGWASIDTHIIWPDAVQAKLKEVFGSKEPLKIHSKISLLGNFSSSVSSPAVEWADQAAKLSWAGLSGDINVAGQKKVEFDFKAPKLVVMDIASKTNQLTLEKIHYEGNQADMSAPFSDTNAAFNVANIETNIGGTPWALKGLAFKSSGGSKNDLLEFNVSYDVNKIEINKKAVGDFKSKLTVNNIKAAAAAEAYKTFAKLQKQCNPAPDQLIKALKPVLKNGFNIKLDNADLSLFDGHAKASGALLVPPLSDADLQVPQALISKITATGLFQVTDKLLVGVFNQVNQLKGQPAGSPAEARQAIQMLMQGGVDQGFVSKTADGYQTIFTFKDGQPVVNGKALGQGAGAAIQQP